MCNMSDDRAARETFRETAVIILDINDEVVILIPAVISRPAGMTRTKRDFDFVFWQNIRMGKMKRPLCRNYKQNILTVITKTHKNEPSRRPQFAVNTVSRHSRHLRRNLRSLLSKLPPKMEQSRCATRFYFTLRMSSGKLVQIRTILKYITHQI